jgi:hypothetical protein
VPVAPALQQRGDPVHEKVHRAGITGRGRRESGRRRGSRHVPAERTDDERSEQRVQMRLPRRLDVERLEPSRRSAQRGRGVEAAAREQRQPPAQHLRSSAQQGRQRVLVDGREQVVSLVGSAGREPGFHGVEQPLDAPLRIR